MFERFSKQQKKDEPMPVIESLADLIQQREALRAFMDTDSVGKADWDALETLNERIRGLGGN